MFLFLAGVSVSLAPAASAAAQVARRVRPWAAAWPMVKRGGWIWVLAILFRVQSDVLGGRTTLGQLLVLDIIRGNTLRSTSST